MRHAEPAVEFDYAALDEPEIDAMAKSDSIWTAFKRSLLYRGMKRRAESSSSEQIIMDDTRPSPRNRQVLIVFVLCFLLLALMAAWFWMAPRAVIVRGEIEATRVNLAIKVVARLQERNVRIGDQVKKGDRLLTLVSPDLEAKLVQAMAASNIAEIEMQKLLLQTRAEDAQQQLKTWHRAREISEEAERSFDRARQMQVSARVQPTQNFETIQTGNNRAQATARNAEKAGADNRQEDEDLTIARAAQAKAVVLELQKNLEELNVVAPLGGEVAQIHIERGELANPDVTLITLVDLSEVWVTANLREDLLARSRRYESLKGKVPALGDQEVEFEITSISPLADFTKSATTINDSHVKLRIFKLLAVPTRHTEGLRPGMSVIFEIPSSSSKVWQVIFGKQP
jgi:HlyD family secretion protein